MIEDGGRRSYEMVIVDQQGVCTARSLQFDMDVKLPNRRHDTMNGKEKMENEANERG